MSEPAFDLAFLRDPRLRRHAIAAYPAWLWAADGTHIVWGNAAGAAAFGAGSLSQLTQHRFDSAQPLGPQIARLAAMLPLDAKPRLERLRGLGRALTMTTCSAEMMRLPDGSTGLLI